jgi:hypothetical protein
LLCFFPILVALLWAKSPIYKAFPPCMRLDGGGLHSYSVLKW